MRLLRPLLTGALFLAAPACANAIVGGSETAREWPHMAAMEFKGKGDKDFSFRCGGSLVRRDVVLSAAHCVDGDQDNGEPDTFPATNFRFVLGSRDRVEGGERIEVVQVVEHPQWDDGKDSHDVALLKLARPTTLGAPIRIADQSDAGASSRATRPRSSAGARPSAGAARSAGSARPRFPSSPIATARTPTASPPPSTPRRASAPATCSAARTAARATRAAR